MSFAENIRRKLVVLKVTLRRGYDWCNVPFLSVVFAGALKPYLPAIAFWMLIIIAVVIMLSIGMLDKKLKLLHGEQDYLTETNPTLMMGLRRQLK